MKLRSGKVLPIRVDKLPEDLDNLLEARLHEFKTMFSNNPQHAKELLNLISKCKSRDNRIDVRQKVAEGYDENELETVPLTAAAGGLMRLVVGNYEYHNLIQTRMKGFDLEIPLLGSDEISMGEL
jgi:hypothetical protein